MQWYVCVVWLCVNWGLQCAQSCVQLKTRLAADRWLQMIVKCAQYLFHLKKYTPTKVSAVGFGATDIACIVAGAVVAYPAMKWMWWLSQVIFVWFAMKYCKHQNKNWCNTDITRGEIGGARRVKPSWTSLNYLRTPLKHTNSIIFWLLIWLWCFSEDIRRRRLAW